MRPRGSLRAALLCGLAGGALSAAVQLPFLGRYGWHRDELYFLSAARRPALGYVDFPPLTAWIGWLVHALAGDSRDALRLTSLAAGIGVIRPRAISSAHSASSGARSSPAPSSSRR